MEQVVFKIDWKAQVILDYIEMVGAIQEWSKVRKETVSGSALLENVAPLGGVIISLVTTTIMANI